MKQALKSIWQFFPIQLLMLHVKSNQSLLLLWVLLFALINQAIGSSFGLPYLFLSPEYLGKSNFLSHVILGFSIGGFITAFQITSYITNGYKFPFLATLNKPFTKYFLNNSLIPIAFVINLLIEQSKFQLQRELLDYSQYVVNSLGLLLGCLFFISLAISYFLTTNKGFQKLFSNTQPIEQQKVNSPVKNVLAKNEKWYLFIHSNNTVEVGRYWSSFFKISKARDCSHYNKQLLQTVFAQNFINATFFELFVFLSVLFFAVFGSTQILTLPAAASSLLFFTVIIMATSAVYSWFKGWSTLIFIGLAFLFNYITATTNYNFKSQAIGLDYSLTAPVNDTIALDRITIQNDFNSAQSLLNSWRNQFGKKPQLVLINVSGGGLRSAIWSFSVLQKIQELTQNKLSKNSILITGSSGGMLGAAYYRESLLDSSLTINELSHDLLNPVVSNLMLRDWFFRIKNYQYNGFSYTLDRGVIFENQLNNNTNNRFNKPIKHWESLEREHSIPQLIFSPTIANNGARLLISSQPVSYLCEQHFIDDYKTLAIPRNLDFRSILKHNQSDSIALTTALRMSATFPYVMPNVTLPTKPTIEVIDAGVNDNIGVVTALEYLLAHKSWVDHNTAGVLLIQIRDKPQVSQKTQHSLSIFESVTRPLKSVYGNFLTLQNYQHQRMLEFFNATLEVPLKVVSIELPTNDKQPVSLSWHLTQFEKTRLTNELKNKEIEEKILEISSLLN